MRTLVTAATFEQRWQAEAAQNHLRKVGIESEIEDDTAAQQAWCLLEPHASARLLTESSVVQEAREKISDFTGIIRCPECHASEVQYPQTTRKFPMPLWAFAMMVKIGFLEPEYFCESCHHTWPVSERRTEPEPDALGWPRH